MLGMLQLHTRKVPWRAYNFSKASKFCAPPPQTRRNLKILEIHSEKINRIHNRESSRFEISVKIRQVFRKKKLKHRKMTPKLIIQFHSIGKFYSRNLKISLKFNQSLI